MFNNIIYVGFLLFSFLLMYIFAGYPLLLRIMDKFGRQKDINKKEICPKISIIIPAYNEEKSISNKLDNILACDYCESNKEIIVISDYSSDRTDEIVKSYQARGIKLVRMERRTGKVAAYKKVVPNCNGEIIFFTDATSVLKKDALTKIISNFNDPSVGCVGGYLRFVPLEGSRVGQGENEYWDYEIIIKRLESNISSSTSVSGTFYAVYKKLFPLDMRDDLADDFIVPIRIKKMGYRVVLEPEAVCEEFTVENEQDEIGKRERITIQNIRGLIDQVDILNPFKYGIYAILILSHKLGRLLVPGILIYLAASSVILAFKYDIFKVIIFFQILFYLVGFSSLNRKVKNKLINKISYFCLSNLSIFLGFNKFMKGRNSAFWETKRPNN